jgi:hypothetical protein
VRYSCVSWPIDKLGGVTCLVAIPVALQSYCDVVQLCRAAEEEQARGKSLKTADSSLVYVNNLQASAF